MTSRAEDGRVGTGHQVSGPWQEVFGPGGLTAAESQPADIEPADSQPAGTGDRDGDAVDLAGDADPEAVARTIVLRKLTARDRTRQELSKALKAKNVPEKVAGEVLDRMQDVGLVDDTRFAESWVRSRQQRRGLSKMALRRELSDKGIDRDTIDETLQSVEVDDEYSAALMLVEKKLRSMSGLEPHVQKRRLFGALARRGFSSGLSSRVIHELLR